jgi:NitT/TauT family transport system substrate-binding protein
MTQHSPALPSPARPRLSDSPGPRVEPQHRGPRRPRFRPARLKFTVAAAFLSCLALGLAACSSSSTASGDPAKVQQLAIVLAWYPTAEYGGLYAAEDQHYFSALGLNVRIIPGGPNVNSTAIVAAGRAQVGFAGDNSSVMTAAESFPFVEIGTEFEIDPEGIEYHQAHPISSFSQLSGRTLYVTPGDPAYEWIAKKYHLHNVTLGSFSYPVFVHNPNSLEFGFVTDDLPTLAASGVKAGYLLPSNFGYNDNGDVLFATRSYVQSSKPVLQRFMLALERGWSYYRTHYATTDVTIYHDDTSVPLSVENKIAQAEMPFVFAGAARTHGLLYISVPQFTQDYQTLHQLGVVKSLPISQVVDPLSSASVKS